MEGYELPAEGVWAGFKRLRNRYWNAFGLTGSRSIVCEINFPFDGTNRRVAGVLATDSTGEICVLHRGRIGGGRQGIGKALFKRHFTGRWISIEGDEMALVGSLKDRSFVKQVAGFVVEISNLKATS